MEENKEVFIWYQDKELVPEGQQAKSDDQGNGVNKNELKEVVEQFDKVSELIKAQKEGQTKNEVLGYFWRLDLANAVATSMLAGGNWKDQVKPELVKLNMLLNQKLYANVNLRDDKAINHKREEFLGLVNLSDKEDEKSKANTESQDVAE